MSLYGLIFLGVFGLKAQSSSITRTSYNILKSTNINTDLLISDNGFFVLNSKPDGTGEFLYTRLDSFSEDAEGRLKNTEGYYLMELDNERKLPSFKIAFTENSQNYNIDSKELTVLDNINDIEFLKDNELMLTLSGENNI